MFFVKQKTCKMYNLKKAFGIFKKFMTKTI